jgi:hypothetical protein
MAANGLLVSRATGSDNRDATETRIEPDQAGVAMCSDTSRQISIQDVLSRFGRWIHVSSGRLR